MRTEKILPYGRQSISEDDIQAVIEVLKGDFLTQGPAIDKFEAGLSSYLGCKHVIVVNSGTAALHVSYAASGVGPQDAVIVPAITFAATANAAVYCGATPIFADVNSHSGLMTVETMSAAIDRAISLNLRPKLVVPVHYAGLPVDMADIIRVSANHGCLVFEDACHALGANYRTQVESEWRRVGNWTHGSIGAAFSFHPVKHIATGEGGAIATNDDNLAAKCRLLRTHGITKAAPNFVRKDLAIDNTTGQANPWYYEMLDLGWNYRMCDIVAALGASQLLRLEFFVEKRKELALRYQDLLRSVSEVSLPVGSSQISEHSWHLFPVRINFAAIGLSRAEFMKHLRLKGIVTQVHYLPVPDLPYYSRYAQFNEGCAVNAREFYDQELSLPMFPDMLPEEVDHVVSAIKSILTMRV